MDKHELDHPLNPTERYLHGMNVRLDVLIHQLSSLLEYLATSNGVAVQDNTVVETPVKSRKRKEV